MKTRITELLGIKYPIIQAGMTFVSYLPLVVAVSEAGTREKVRWAMQTCNAINCLVAN